MPSKIDLAGVIPSILALLLLLLALLLPWTGWPSGSVVAPVPEILVFINGRELHTVKQPVTVTVKKGERVSIKIQVYHQGQPVDPGEFSYQWCFDPPVNNNLHCSENNYKGETNLDYKPTNLKPQELKITIHHTFLRTSTITILFNPE